MLCTVLADVADDSWLAAEPVVADSAIPVILCSRACAFRRIRKLFPFLVALTACECLLMMGLLISSAGALG